MKTRLILGMMIAMASVSSHAQTDDADWQTGGGRDEPSHYYADDNANGSLYTYTRQNDYNMRGKSLFRTYYEHPLSVNIGYATKEWVSETAGGTIHENFFGEEGKRLHGLQLGLDYQPSLQFGLGLHTGVQMEIYISTSPYVHQRNFDSFSELSLYVPLHAAYRLPLSHRSSLSLYGGLGFNAALVGEYQDNHEYYDTYTGALIKDTYTECQRYGSGWPKRLNAAAEVGASLNIQNYRVGFTYSRGLNNHNLYPGFKTHQNKLSFTFGYVFTLD